MNIVQQLIQGLSIGSIYGLVALGYALIYQTWRVLNFAQGDVCAIGAFSIAGYIRRMPFADIYCISVVSNIKYGSWITDRSFGFQTTSQFQKYFAIDCNHWSKYLHQKYIETYFWW